MVTRSSNAKLASPLPKPKNRRRRWNKQVPISQKDLRPENPKEIVPSVDETDNEPMWANERIVAPTPGPAITLPDTSNEFAIKGNHLTLVKGNQFDGRNKIDPHKHIHEFLGICEMFRYGETKNEAVRLMMFPLSLTGDTKTVRWTWRRNHSNMGWTSNILYKSIHSPTLFNRLLGEICAFSQQDWETLTESWLRMKEMLRNCHGFHQVPNREWSSLLYITLPHNISTIWRKDGDLDDIVWQIDERKNKMKRKLILERETHTIHTQAHTTNESLRCLYSTLQEMP